MQNMSKVRFSLTSILFYIIIVGTCFLVENLAFFTGDKNAGLDTTSFWLATVAVIIMFIVYLVIENKRNKIHVNATWTVLLILAFFLFGFMIWVDKPEYGIQWDLLTKVEYTICLALALLAIYITCFYQSKKRTRNGGLLWFLYFYLIFIVIAIIYSLVSEMDLYKQMFDSSVSASLSIGSFFGNKNIYAMFILFGILCLAIINYHRSNFINYIFMFILYIALVFTKSGTSLISATFFLFFYLVYRFIKYSMTNWKGGLAIFCAFIIIVVALLIGDAFLTRSGYTFINSTLISVFEDLNIPNNSTFTGRTEIWSDILSALESNPLYLIFGLGYKVTPDINAFFEYPVQSAHSAYLQVFLEGGIIGLICYASMLIYTFYCCIRLMKKGKVEYGYVFIIALLTLILHGVAESTVIFGTNSSGIILGFIFILSPIISWHRLKNPEKVEVVEVEKPVIYDYSRLQRFFTAILWGVVISAAMLFMFNYTTGGSHPFFNKCAIYLLITLIISLLFLPTIFAGVLGKGSQHAKVAKITIYSILIVGMGLVGGLICYYFDQEYFLLGFVLGYGVTSLVICLCYAGSIGRLGEQILNFLKGITVTQRYGLISEVVVEVILYLVITFGFSYEWNMLSILIVSLLGIGAYFMGFMFYPSHEVKRTIEYFNDWQINKNLKYHEKRYDI